jgi:hypothetical protein
MFRFQHTTSIATAVAVLITILIAPQAAGQCSAPLANMVAWWDADESSPGTAVDLLAGHDGAMINGASLVPGYVGQAYAFDGSNDYIEVPDNPDLRISDVVTIEFWVRRTRFGIDLVCEKGGDWTVGQTNYGVGLHGSRNSYMFYFFFNGGWRGTPGPSDKAWHHYAVVAMDGQANATFYIDGAVQPGGLRGGTAVIDLNPSTLPLHIGAQVGRYNYAGANIIDELSIYHAALSAEDIQDIYDAGTAGKCKPGHDSDLDGLTDAEEGALGTDSQNPDTDADGLLDGTEVNSSLTDPLDADSDDDGLSDGTEVGVGTNPNNPDTDGDGITDAEDPTPLTPGAPGSWIEERLRNDAIAVLALELDCIDAPNANAARGRRNALANKIIDAANKLANGDHLGAIDKLASLLEKLDGYASPPDWMISCPEKDELRSEVELMIYLLGQP